MTSRAETSRRAIQGGERTRAREAQRAKSRKRRVIRRRYIPNRGVPEGVEILAYLAGSPCAAPDAKPRPRRHRLCWHCLWGAAAVLSSRSEQRCPLRSRCSAAATGPCGRSCRWQDSRPLKRSLSSCVTCHNARLKTGGLELDGLDLAQAARARRRLGEGRAARCARASCRRRASAVPSPQALAGVRRLASKTVSIAMPARVPNAGRPMLHRLEPRGIQERHPRPAGARRGRRVAAAARRFGLRLRQHLRRARRVALAAGALSRGGRARISALAVGDPPLRPGSETYRVRAGSVRRTSTSRGCRSAPSAACRCATSFRSTANTTSRPSSIAPTSTWSAASSMRASSKCRSTARPCTTSRLAATEDLGATVRDAAPIRATRWKRGCGCRVKVPAGPHEVTVAFVEQLAVKDTVRVQPFLRSSADNFEWAGRAAHSDAGGHRAVRPDRARATRRAVAPSSPASPPRESAERACATQILGRLARRALSAAGRRRGAGADSRVLRRGAQPAAAFEARHPARPAAHPRQPALRLPPRARSGGRRARQRSIR